MQFPLGKPILAMLLVAAVSGAAIVLRPVPKRADLSLWVFDDDHSRAYRTLEPGFRHVAGHSLRVELIGNTAINMRLSSLFLSGRSGAALPDAAEIEIGSIGRYLRPPAQDVGFLPLNDLLANSGRREIRSLTDPGHRGWNARLARDGHIYTHDGARWQLNPSRIVPDSWLDRILPARLAPWTKDGVIFGIPHDVHPVTLTYRDDLFREAGIDLSTATTWPQFQEMCLAFQRYWMQHGKPHRHAMELPPSSSDDLVLMLLQRHVNVVDDRGRVHIADPRVAATITFYAQLAAGPRAIGTAVEGGTHAWIGDLEAGNACCIWTPDWKCNELRTYSNATALRGKLRMMPLPRFQPDDAPTATWGGTMIGIPRRCIRPAESWKLIEYLYLSEAGLHQQAISHNLPALPEQWSGPLYQQPDPLFGGQKVDRLYADLAAQIPMRYVTPVTTLAQLELAAVVSRAVEHSRRYGTDGLEAKTAGWLEWFERDVERRVEHATFDEP